MSSVVAQALRLWGMEGARTQLIAARENSVYKVITNTGVAALRVHRQGYRRDAELHSELAWMAAVARSGIHVPAPVVSLSGNRLHVIEGIQVDVLTWLCGATLDSIVTELTSQERGKVFFKLGQQMAKLHQVSDAWVPDNDFTRGSWNQEGLVGDIPLWDRFWNNPALTGADQRLFLQLRHKAAKELSNMGESLDYGLIHADLVSANIMVSEGRLSLIDFDDGGYGYRVFELVTALLKFSDDEDYLELKTELIHGYQQIRPIDLHTFDLFMALRAATYVGWNIKRMHEDGGQARNARFIDAARKHATTYLNAR